jgi:type VI secretion system protein ImpH
VATTSRPADSTVAESPLKPLLASEPYCFGFFQAVRLLERLAPGRDPVGTFGRPSHEAVRFTGNSSLSFLASEIQSLSFPEDGGPAQMMVNFMGLTGVEGSLPRPYTEMVLERIRDGDTVLRDFLDIFNHRLVSLFYRAWRRYRFAASYEGHGGDGFSDLLLDLVGLGTPALRDRQEIPDSALLFYTGLLAMHSRSATALRQILSDYFEVDVEIEQFAGVWRRLDAGELCRFEQRNGASDRLGLGVVVGDEFWDQQSVVRIRLGPLPLDRYRDFLPDGSAYRSLQALTRFFSGALEFEVQLVLRHNHHDRPLCVLGDESATSPRLGWVSWMRRTPDSTDVDDTVLKL